MLQAYPVCNMFKWSTKHWYVKELNYLYKFKIASKLFLIFLKTFLGADGRIGLTGPSGITGFTGEAGMTGSIGSRGLSGPTGKSIIVFHFIYTGFTE